MLDMTLREIERVLYFEAFVVVEPGMTELERGQLLTDESTSMHSSSTATSSMPAWVPKPFSEMLMTIDLERSIARVREEIDATRSETKIKRLSKRLKLLEAFHRVGQQARVDGPGRFCRFCRRICVRWYRLMAAVLRRLT